MEKEDWNEKHRPMTLADVWGNPSAVNTIQAWAEDWEHRIPNKRAILLHGPPGIGKTSAALALAKDMGWGVVELNASDARNAESIKNSVALGAVNETFSADGTFISTKDGGRKLIVIDEADSLYERDSGGGGGDGEGSLDKGGKRAILALINNTNQPVILIVNDLYALTKDKVGAEYKRKTLGITFKRINSNTIFKRLIEIARREGVSLEPEAARMIASKSGGDMRAALNDLQALAMGRKTVRASHVDSMGARDTEKTIYDLLRTIFGSMSGKAAYEVSKSLDESPDMMLLWVDENLPGAYRNPKDLAAAYDCLSKADIYLARASRKNHYRLWPYASYMMTGGVAVSKMTRYSSFPRFSFPQWLIAMSRSKGERGIRTSVTTKIGKVTHASKAEVIDDILPYIQALFKQDDEFRTYLSYSLSFSDKEIMFMLDDTRDSPLVKETLHEVQRLIEKRGTPSIEIPFFQGAMASNKDEGKAETKSEVKPLEIKAEPPKAEEPEEAETEEEEDTKANQTSLFEF